MNSSETPVVVAPVQRDVRPRSEWEHLMAYGYAPGHYMNTCHVCKQTVQGVDKRAITCRLCAEKRHAERTAKQPCGECHLQPGERCDVCGASSGA